MRHPLHRIASIIFYEDGFGKNMLAFKIGAAEEEIYDCYIYECESEVRTILYLIDSFVHCP